MKQPILLAIIVLIAGSVLFSTYYFSLIEFDHLHQSQIHLSSSTTTPTEECKWEFVSYQPSEWEQWWAKDIDTLNMKVCPTMNEDAHFAKAVKLVETVLRWSNQPEPTYELMGDELLHIFSRMIWSRRCLIPDGHRVTSTAIQLIEPVVGNTRDPLTMCTINHPLPASVSEPTDLVQSKRHLLFAHSAPWVILDGDQLHASLDSLRNVEWTVGVMPSWYTRGQFFALDLGSSYYDAWNSNFGAYSTRFFVDTYARRHVRFHHMWAFEHQELSPPEVWTRVPEDMLAFYTMINHGVTSDGKFNPWNLLMSIAKPEDYVLIKLDIDTPQIEMPLMNQMVEDDSKRMYVDEMTFEHHVDLPELRPYWGNGLAGTLVDTYHIFITMREKGVRMHSWP